MIPSWVNDTVRAFGRQMKLGDFSLNENGAAGLRFENGIALYLEYSDGAMMISAGVAADDSNETVKRLLACAHPSARTGGVRFRAFRLARTGEARLVARILDRELTPTALESVFRALWETLENLRRAIA